MGDKERPKDKDQRPLARDGGDHDKNKDKQNRYSEQRAGQSRPTQNNGRPR